MADLHHLMCTTLSPMPSQQGADTAAPAMSGRLLTWAAVAVAVLAVVAGAILGKSRRLLARFRSKPLPVRHTQLVVRSTPR